MRDSWKRRQRRLSLGRLRNTSWEEKYRILRAGTCIPCGSLFQYLRWCALSNSRLAVLRSSPSDQCGWLYNVSSISAVIGLTLVEELTDADRVVSSSHFRKSRNEAHICGDEPEHLTHTLLLLECQPHTKRDENYACNSLQDVTDACTKSALPGLTDQIAIEVEPTQKDRLIGKHHQHQPQWRITWTDKWWQSRGKDGTSLRVEQIVQQSLPEGDPFTELRRLRSRCRHGGLLVPPEAGDQASQAEIPQVCRPNELTHGEGDH